MMNVFVIAWNTYRETIRNRVLYNILFFAIFLIVLSIFVGDWSLGERVKIVKDFGLATMSIFGLLIAIFIGIGLVHKEIEKKTIYFVLAKPVRRFEVILGKYLGLILTLLINLTIMTIGLYLVLWFIEGELDWALLKAISLIYLEILVVISVAILFSTLTSPTLSAILTLVVFISGHTTPTLKLFMDRNPQKLFSSFLKVIYYLVPNLSNFNIRGEVVHHLPVDSVRLFYILGYGVFYVSIMLMLSILVFRKKDLK
jgi:ABC-type transport system involved in multi-copper enzyme maturation permease subunit